MNILLKKQYDGVLKEMEGYISKGEIPNPVFFRLKEWVSHMVYKIGSEVNSHYRSEEDTLDPQIQFLLRYNFPWYREQLKKWERQVSKIERESLTLSDQQILDNLITVFEKQKHLLRLLDQLKPMIVSAKPGKVAKREQDIDSDWKMLETLLVQVKDLIIDSYRLILINQGKLTQEKIERELKLAEIQFSQSVRKLAARIGKPVKQVNLDYQEWRFSGEIVCSDGTSQKWEGKVIVNRSKYDKYFLQYHFRRVD